jgi:hypothetical protein
LGVLRILLTGVRPGTLLPMLEEELNPTPPRKKKETHEEKHEEKAAEKEDDDDDETEETEATEEPETTEATETASATTTTTITTMGAFLVQLLTVLVQWVPHSVNDDTFHCLSMLLRLTQGMLSPDHASTVLDALLDRWVKAG